MKISSTRSGRLVQTLSGYTAFIPSTLPLESPIQIDPEMQRLLSDADRKLGRLDGITRVLPNPNLFLAMYVKKEALLSSQIEGTQASLVDVLSVPKNVESTKTRNDVEDVVNYVHAMNYGLARLQELPMSLRLLREIHGQLLRNVRGSEKNPGEFRRSQNWIGAMGCTLSNATFVPPPVEEMNEALWNLEEFINSDAQYIPPLIKIAMIHAQFETIHPFLDGNGRVGRLLITFWLCQQHFLEKPLLYLSYYFKQNRLEYYDRLMRVRLHGEWEEWVKFFLKGIAEVSDEATDSAERIIRLKENFTDLVRNQAPNASYAIPLLDFLFENPIIARKDVVENFHVSSPTAKYALETFCKLGILLDVDQEKQKNKRYRFQPYLDILERGTE